MKNFHQTLKEIVEKINYIESRRVKIGNFLRKINDSFKIGPNDEISDSQIINKVPDSPLERVSVLGVDGGIVTHSYHGLDLILMRAVGVNFIYSNNSLEKVFYYPSSNPFPNPRIVLDSFSDIELSSCFNLERQIMEIDTCIESMEKLKPDVVLLDGSVIPHYVSKPDNTVLKSLYKKLIETYYSLFEKSKKMKIILAGVIEDSRGAKFCDILNRRIVSELGTDLGKELKLILEKTKDTNLLFYALKKGERSCVFNYSKNPMIHPILKEFEDMQNSFFSFYIKTVEFDRPLRVDFVGFGNELDIVNKLSSVLMRTSGHSGYGLPAVLIEADQRAKLTEKDLDMFYFELINKVGNVSSLFKMRRDMRPF